MNADKELKLIIGALVVENTMLRAQVEELAAKLKALAEEQTEDEQDEMS